MITYGTTLPLTAQGYDVAAHVLGCFGGAGGQHACAIARALGMRTIFIHMYAGILSAVGIHMADIVQVRDGLLSGERHKGIMVCSRLLLSCGGDFHIRDPHRSTWHWQTRVRALSLFSGLKAKCSWYLPSAGCVGHDGSGVMRWARAHMGEQLHAGTWSLV